jgi:membrane-associated phospholipid phosphatase
MIRPLLFLLLPLFLHAQNLDYRILKSVNRNDMPAWDRFNHHVSFSVYPVMPSVAGGILLHGYVKDDRDLMRNGFKSIVAISLASATSTGVKYLLARPRPFKAYPGDIIQRDANVGPLSFPSGHTTVAFASATALSLTYKKWYVAVPAYAWAGMVGYSRMRMGVHYPSDVLAGIIVGLGSGLLVWELEKVLYKK